MIDFIAVADACVGATAKESEAIGNPWRGAAVGGCMKILPLDAWLLPRGRSRKKLWTLDHTRSALEKVFGEDMHLARVRSLANGVAGVLNAVVVTIAAIGRAYAQVAGIKSKSGVKQIDRFLGNGGVVLDEVMPLWVQHVVGTTPRIVLAMDWTDFENDDHTTLCVYAVTTHGRATPLAWRTVKKSTLKKRRTGYELDMVRRLHRWLPASVEVTLLADRGFGYAELYEELGALGWDYVIRFRQGIIVSEAGDAGIAAADLVPPHGRVRKIVGATVTRKRSEVPAVVLVKRKGMKEAWCLATSLASADANEIVKAYSRRFTIEETFRDTKDITFGLGLRATHISDASRRDRMLLLVAIAHTLLTLLGAASEASGLDRTLKTNTSPKRTMSLFNQGLYWYQCLADMRDDWLEQLLTAYEKILREHKFLCDILKFEPPAERTK
jgi:hypothetical protein